MPEHALYINAASAPCRAVLLHHHLVRDDFGPLELVPVDLMAREQDPELLRRNPQHTVPTLVTPWGTLWESRAILRYIEAMLPEPRLYPTGVYVRAVIDRLLDWDLGTLYRAVSTIVYPAIFRGVMQPASEDIDKLLAAVRFLDREQLGDGRPYLCGADLSIADISIAMTLSTLRLIGLHQIDDVPHLTAWQQRMTEIDGYAEIDAPFSRWVEEIQTTNRQWSVDMHERLNTIQLESARADLALITGAAEGGRNIATQRAACLGYDHQVDEHTWLFEVYAWNERENQPPLPREEVEEIVRQSYARRMDETIAMREHNLAQLDRARTELATWGSGVPGEKQESTRRVAEIGYGLGVDLDQWIYEVQKWNERNATPESPGLPPEEVEAIVRQGYLHEKVEDGATVSPHENLDRALAGISKIPSGADGVNLRTAEAAIVGLDMRVDIDTWLIEVQKWNERANQPPLPREVVENIVRQTYARHGDAAAPPEPAVADAPAA